MEVEEVENQKLSQEEENNKLEEVQIEALFIFSNVLLSDSKQKENVVFWNLSIIDLRAKSWARISSKNPSQLRKSKLSN